MQIDTNYKRKKNFVYATLNQIVHRANLDMMNFYNKKIKLAVLVKDDDMYENGKMKLLIFAPHNARIRVFLYNKKMDVNNFKSFRKYIMQTIINAIQYISPDSVEDRRDYSYFIMLYNLILLDLAAMNNNRNLDVENITHISVLLRAKLASEVDLDTLNKENVKELNKQDKAIFNLGKYLISLNEKNEYQELLKTKHPLHRFCKLYQEGAAKLTHTAHKYTGRKVKQINTKINAAPTPTQARKLQDIRKEHKQEKADIFDRNKIAFLRNEGRA